MPKGVAREWQTIRNFTFFGCSSPPTVCAEGPGAKAAFQRQDFSGALAAYSEAVALVEPNGDPALVGGSSGGGGLSTLLGDVGSKVVPSSPREDSCLQLTHPPSYLPASQLTPRLPTMDPKPRTPMFLGV